MGVTQILSLVARASLSSRRTTRRSSITWRIICARCAGIIDPANHAEAVAIVSKFTKLPPAHFEPWLLTKGDQYRNPAGRPNLEAMQHNIEVQKEFGFIDKAIDVKKYADLSLIDAADKRLAAEATKN